LRKRVADLERQYAEVNQDCINNGVSITACRDITDTNKLDIDELKKLIKQLQNNAGSNSGGSTGRNNEFTFTQNDFDNLEDKLRMLEAKLDSKVDNDVFDNEIA
jgi:chromosome segregation ATPase